MLQDYLNNPTGDPSTHAHGDQSMIVWDVANNIGMEGWGWEIGNSTTNSNSGTSPYNFGDTWSTGQLYQVRTVGMISTGAGFAPLLPRNSTYTGVQPGYSLGQSSHAAPANQGLSSSGMSYLWLDVTVNEVYNLGVIAHPLALACTTTSTIRPPALTTDGSSTGTALDQGTLFQLTITQTQINTITPPIDRMCAQAMHDYGFFVTDTAGSVAILFENDNSWVNGNAVPFKSPWYNNTLTGGVGLNQFPLQTTGGTSLNSFLTSGNLRSISTYSL
jgi:hypothetical protein